MNEKMRRPFDDFMRLLAMIICLAPIATYCAAFIVTFIVSLSAGAPVPLEQVVAGLKDLVLLVIGGAVGLAFGMNMNRDKLNPKEKD